MYALNALFVYYVNTTQSNKCAIFYLANYFLFTSQISIIKKYTFYKNIYRKYVKIVILPLFVLKLYGHEN